MPRDGSAPIVEIEKPGVSRAPLAGVEGLARSLSPVDLPEPAVPLPHGLKWTSEMIATACLVLALLNAHAIRSWAYQLPPSATSAHVVTAAEGWYDLVGRVGLNAPVEAMHGRWQAARDARFAPEPHAADQATAG